MFENIKNFLKYVFGIIIIALCLCLVLVYTMISKCAPDKDDSRVEIILDSENLDVTILNDKLKELKSKENEAWTESRVKNNPQEYLKHSEEVLNMLYEECIKIEVYAEGEKRKLERDIDELNEVISNSDWFIKEAETIASTSTKEYPIKIGAYFYTQQTFTNAVIEADQQKKDAKKKLDKQKNKLNKINELLKVIEKTKQSIKVELETIVFKSENLKIDQACEASKEIKKRIDNLLVGKIDDNFIKSNTPIEKEKTLEEIFKTNK